MLNTSNSTHQNDGSNWLYIAVHVTSSITFTIGFPTNIIIIYLVSRRRNLKNPTNYFVCSLAAADVMVLIWMMIWLIGIHAFPLIKMMHKYVFPSLDIFLGAASMLNVACVSTDRAIAVAYPLNYENIVTKSRSFMVILSCWIYSLSVLIAALCRANAHSLTYNKVILYCGFVSYFVPVITIFVCYSLILLVIVHKLKGIRELEKVISNARQVFNNQDMSEKNKRRRRKLLRELKVTGNVLLIVVPFTTGWTFFIGTHLYEETVRAPVQGALHNFVIIIIPWMLSGLNPVIYLMLNRSLRQAFITVLHKLCQSNNYNFDDSKTSFLVSLSRRASNAFRRTSTSVDDGNGFLSVSKTFGRRRDSRISSSLQSRGSSDVMKDTEAHSSRNYVDGELIQYATVV